MRVCLLSAERYPYDPRIALQARGLVDAGHDAVLLCRGGEGEAGRELVGDLDVDRLPVEGPLFDAEGTPEEVGYAARTTHSAWESGISRLEGEDPIDVIGAHGLGLAKTALEAGENSNIPVVLDFAADPVADLAQRRAVTGKRALVSQPGTLVSRTLASPRRLRRLEAACVERADRIVVASEEARARYIRARDVPPEEVRVVRSTVDPAAFDAADTDRPVGLDFSPDGEFIATYVGSIVPGRGLETLIDALARVSGVMDARVVLVGEGPDDYITDLRERADEAGVAERLTVATRAEPKDHPAHLALADAAVFPFPESEYAETALPHALFQAFAAGTPAVVDDVSPLRRVVTRADAGLVASESYTDLAAALRVLGRDPERAAALGVNGRREVERGGAFDAARDRVRIARIYDELRPATGRRFHTDRLIPLG
jgi:glycosyltransferase involved in cell wall biosynthesis